MGMDTGEIPNGFCIGCYDQMICRQNATYVVLFAKGNKKRYLTLKGAKAAAKAIGTKYKR